MYIDEKKSNFDLKISFDCVNFIYNAISEFPTLKNGQVQIFRVF